MLEFGELIQESDRIMFAILADERVDYSRLRDICRRFNDRCVVVPVFKCDGTDKQLWDSVNTYFQKLLKKI